MDELISVLRQQQQPELADGLAGPDPAPAQQALGAALVGNQAATPADILAAISAAPADLAAKLAQAKAALATGQPGPAAQPDQTPAAPAGATGADTLAAKVKTEADDNARDTLITLEATAANERATVRQAQFAANDRTSEYLAFFITAGFLLIILVIIIRGIGPNEGVLTTLLGVLGTGWVSVITFYFGSSVGSKEKTALLGEQNPPGKVA